MKGLRATGQRTPHRPGNHLLGQKSLSPGQVTGSLEHCWGLWMGGAAVENAGPSRSSTESRLVPAGPPPGQARGTENTCAHQHTSPHSSIAPRANGPKLDPQQATGGWHVPSRQCRAAVGWSSEPSGAAAGPGSRQGQAPHRRSARRVGGWVGGGLPGHRRPVGHRLLPGDRKTRNSGDSCVTLRTD